MAVKAVFWNIEGRLTRFAEAGQRGSPEHIIEGIRELDGDVVFLAEASDGDAIEPDINEQLQCMGYQIHTVCYDDGGKDRKWSAEKAPNMKLLTRLAVTSFKQIRLGDIRNALVAEVIDPDSEAPLRIFGVHLDDRSEEYRLSQTEDLLKYVHESSLPTIVGGDYNAMHANDIRARGLRNRLARKVFASWPNPRMKDEFMRLLGMATGDALARLEAGSTLRDADPRRRATITPKARFQEWMPSIPLFQIDHMYVSPDISVTDFSISRDGGSDHRAISANISVAGQKR